MKRDMDLVREILLAVEEGYQTFGGSSLIGRFGAEPPVVLEHLRLLEQAGLIEIAGRTLAGTVTVRGLTWEGHDFADTLRDPEIYKKAKSAAATVGGVGFKALVEIGKAVAKQKLQDLGLPIA